MCELDGEREREWDCHVQVWDDGMDDGTVGLGGGGGEAVCVKMVQLCSLTS